MNKEKKSEHFSKEDITVTAALACIDLNEKESRRFTKALDVILNHFEVIAKVELKETLHGTPVERSMSLDDLRDDDSVHNSPTSLLKAAPDFEEGFFFVPRVTR